MVRVGIGVDMMYVKVVKAWLESSGVHIRVSKPWWLVLGAWILICSSTQGQVIINEVMADNVTAVENEAIFPDWVELYNAGAGAVDMSGWTLTDSQSQPFKFVFPTGTMIEPGTFLMVWCDNLTNAPGFHTGFTLKSKEGDDVTLFDSSLLVQDAIFYGIQVPDLSIGRVPDGSGTWQLNLPTPRAANVPAAFSTFAANLRINEIMARPSGGDDWFELYNPDTNIIHIGGLIWADSGTNFTIANLSFILPGEFIQFIADDHPEDGADHVNFGLGGNGDRVVLYQPDGVTTIDRIDFGVQTNDVSYGRLPDGGTNLVFFGVGKSTPGESNFQLLTDIVINEVLPHTDPPLEDAIELHNPTAAEVDISYWWLSNSKEDPKKFQIPAGTRIAAGGYKVFYEYAGLPGGFNPNGQGTNRSFTLNSARGDQVFLHTADAAGNLTFFRTSQSFGPSENGVSFGRYVTSDGDVDFVRMIHRSFGRDNPSSVEEFRMGTGLPNPGPAVGPLVISEIMYHPPDIFTNDPFGNPIYLDNSLDEFIEIYNFTGAPVPLFDPNFPTNTWRLRDAVDFNFSQGVTLGAHQFLLVVNFDPLTNATQSAAFRSKYGVAETVPIFGPYSGKLGNNGEPIELRKPDPPQTRPPDLGLVPYILVERVTYKDAAPWPTEPDGQGLSLHRIKPEEYGNDPINWLAGDPTPGRAHVRIESMQYSGGSFVLRFKVIAGQSYTVQYQNGIGSGWVTLIDLGLQSTSTLREVTDVGAGGSSSRFYRVVVSAQ